MIRSISLPKTGTDAIVVETSNGLVKVLRTELAILNTSEKMDTALVSRVSCSEAKIFTHLNKDGSLAVAIGAKPNIWPEGEPKEVVTKELGEVVK